MQKKFLQVLVVALAAFAVLADDDLSDDDSGSQILHFVPDEEARRGVRSEGLLVPVSRDFHRGLLYAVSKL